MMHLPEMFACPLRRIRIPLHLVKMQPMFFFFAIGFKLLREMMQKPYCLIAIFLAASTAALGAQTAPTTTATTSTSGPATTRRALWHMTMPPGFVKVAVGDRVAICDPADEAWVK